MANSVKIYCRSIKEKKDGTAPIVYLLIIGRKTTSISSSKFIPPKLFDNKAQLVKTGAGNSRSLNSYLKINKEKLEGIILDLEKEGEEVTAEKIKDRFNNKESISDKDNCFIKYWEGQMRFITSNRRQHNQSLNDLKKYTSILPFKKLNHNWLEAYERHFISEGRKINGYAHNFRSIRFFQLRAVRDKLMNESLFGKYGFKIKSEEVQKEFLSDEEVKKFYKLLISDDLGFALKKSLYWFLLSLETSLRYQDMVKLSRLICKGEDHAFVREKSLFIVQGKGTLPNRIPLTDDALFLLQNPIGEPLKVTNNRVNEDVRKLAKLAGIDRYLTYHCSRHSFAVKGLRAGMNLKAISRVMGHKSVVITEVYAKYDDKTLDAEMDKNNNHSILKNVIKDKEDLVKEMQDLFQNFTGTVEEKNTRIADLSDRIKKL